MYNIREVTLQNGLKARKVLVIDFDEQAMDIVGEFLMADARLLRGKVVEEIEQVLAGKVDVIETSGNRCALEIKADVTKISDLYVGMEGVKTYATYEIETIKLKEIIEMWFQKWHEFQKK